MSTEPDYIDLDEHRRLYQDGTQVWYWRQGDAETVPELLDRMDRVYSEELDTLLDETNRQTGETGETV